MLKTVYFNCNNCDYLYSNYMDTKYISDPINLGSGEGKCPKCGGAMYHNPNYKKITNRPKVYNTTLDDRTVNPKKYQDSKFKDKMRQINKMKEVHNG